MSYFSPTRQITASIVIYRTSPEQVTAAIKSCRSSSLQIKVIVVDNSPTPLMRDIVQTSGAEYHFPGRNLGFGAGHNVAIRKYLSSSDYHLILNPDVYFDSDILVPLYNFMRANPQVGAVMPRVLYPDGSEQHLCKLLPEPMDLIVRRFGGSISRKLFQPRIDRYLLKGVSMAAPRIIPSLSGCFMLLRTEVLKTTDLFDEHYFMYMEDVDLCRRIGEVAYTVFFPGVAIFHEYAKGSYRSKRLLKYHIQSSWYYFCKWGWFQDETRDHLNARLLNPSESAFLNDVHELEG
jgi:GT2 family glycosyltransferase